MKRRELFRVGVGAGAALLLGNVLPVRAEVAYDLSDAVVRHESFSDGKMPPCVLFQGRWIGTLTHLRYSHDIDKPYPFDASVEARNFVAGNRSRKGTFTSPDLDLKRLATWGFPERATEHLQPLSFTDPETWSPSRLVDVHACYEAAGKLRLIYNDELPEFDIVIPGFAVLQGCNVLHYDYGLEGVQVEFLCRSEVPPPW